ncbi:MAG: hypothetical protein GY867_11360 [bacterium]|nr:hypothetical protein [bacterium]
MKIRVRLDIEGRPRLRTILWYLAAVVGLLAALFGSVFEGAEGSPSGTVQPAAASPASPSRRPLPDDLHPDRMQDAGDDVGEPLRWTVESYP